MSSFVPNSAGINYLLHSPTGIVGRYLDDIGDRVQIEAEGIAPVGEGRDGTHLFQSIERSRLIPTADGQMVRVGSWKPYTAAVVRGSKPHVIRPRNARILRFTVGGDTVFARIVRHPGGRANNFLLEAARRILGGS